MTSQKTNQPLPGFAKCYNAALVGFLDPKQSRCCVVLFLQKVTLCRPLLDHRLIKNISCKQSHLEDVLLSSERVALSANVEGDDRQRWDLIADHHVLKYNQHSFLSVLFIYQYHDFNQNQILEMQV